MDTKIDKTRMTKGVQTLLGAPKKAILKLSIPMMIGMLVQTVYQIADGIWVAGLGPDALAAVGLFFPFFIILMALGGGIGVGGSAAVSRRIGEENKPSAEKTAIHTIIIGLLVSGAVTLPFLLPPQAVKTTPNIIRYKTFFIFMVLLSILNQAACCHRHS